MLQFPRWKVDVTVGRDLVKTLYETATTSKAAIDKAKHKLRGAVSSAGTFKFKATKADEKNHATKKSPQQLDREIAEALGHTSRGHATRRSGESLSWNGQTIPIDPSPRTVKPFELNRPYVIRRRGRLYTVVLDTHRGNVAHPAEVEGRTPSSKTRAGKGSAAMRVSHATKATTKGRAKTSDKINIDQLAKLFDLPDWDRIDELNQQHYWEMSQGSTDEEAQLDAERAAQDEVYGQWYDAVESVATKLFDKHGLELQPTGKQGTETRRYEFKIVPSSSWNDAANKIRETINGVGDFHFNDLKEFLHTQASTARQAALSHLGYIRQYPAVYGGSGARQLYDQAWR